jgi:hypothetical protein
MQRLSKSFATLAVVVLLGFASAASAHGHDGDMNMEMGEPSRPTIATTSDAPDAGPQSYFQYGEHSGLLMAHILLMILGWMFILPIGK